MDIENTIQGPTSINLTQDDLNSLMSFMVSNEPTSQTLEDLPEPASALQQSHNLQEEAEEADIDYEEVNEETTEQQNEVLENPEIKLNPINHSNNEFTSRFDGAVWAKKAQSLEIILAGVGGIGSWTGLLLARLDPFYIKIYDNDEVDSTNISGQWYNRDQIGVKKVTALSRQIIDYCGYYKINSIPRRYENSSNADKIMICGFDNMEARKLYFESWYNYLITSSELYKRAGKPFPAKEYLFIDGRLAAEELQVFCLRGDDVYSIEKYAKEYLFDDTEAEPTVCSYKQTSFMSNMIASIITNLFVNFVTNLCDVTFERPLPFYTTYNGEFMIFKTID